MISQNRTLDQFEEHVGDVRAQSVAMQCVAAAFVYDFALSVHHIIVLQQALPNPEIVFLDLFLCPFNGLCDHGMLNHVTFLVAHPIHHFRNPVR